MKDLSVSVRNMTGKNLLNWRQVSSTSQIVYIQTY